jgi:hypothetical protein
MVAAGGSHTVGLKSDGTVVAVGVDIDGQCDVSSWTGITQVAAGGHHTVGLKSDGTVVAVGDDSSGQCSGVSSWTGITQMAAGGYHTVGLKSDGTVVAVGYDSSGQCDVSSWTGITQVAAGWYHTVGLKSDGTVVAVGYGANGQCNVSSWTGITQVSAGPYHTVGLKSDCTVVAVGDNDDGECNVSFWTGITQVSAGGYHTAGLKSGGTVVAVGDNTYGQREVSSWTGITLVSAGYHHTVGLKSDGTVVAVGDNTYGQCDVTGWNVGTCPPLPNVVTGITGEVNCDVLPFAYVELRQGATVINCTTSDAAGNYLLTAPAPGIYDIVVDKNGYRPMTQQGTISSSGPVTLDFIGQTGLIPNAPTVQYVAQCSNHYLYPYGNCGLTVQRVAAVSNAYLYPIVPPVNYFNLGDWANSPPYLIVASSAERTTQYYAPGPIIAPPGTVFIIISVTVANAGSCSFQIAATDFRLVDDFGFGYPPQQPPLLFPNQFPYYPQILAGGHSVSGRILYTVPDISSGLDIRMLVNDQYLAWVLPW